jgi:hypothetical protein
MDISALSILGSVVGGRGGVGVLLYSICEPSGVEERSLVGSGFYPLEHSRLILNANCISLCSTSFLKVKPRGRTDMSTVPARKS